jgi:hypothetical protein
LVGGDEAEAANMFVIRLQHPLNFFIVSPHYWTIGTLPSLESEHLPFASCCFWWKMHRSR